MQAIRPGRQIQYSFREQRIVHSRRGRYQQRFVWGRTGEWTLYFIAGDSQHTPKVAQQLVLAAGQASTYERNGQRVDLKEDGVVLPPVPSANCRLAIGAVASSSVPVVLPGADSFERLLYRLGLDHLSWPADPVAVNEPQPKAIEWDGFTGQRTFRVTDVRRAEGRRQATISVTIAGQFSKRFAGQPRLTLAKTSLRWDLASQSLLGLTSEVRYERSLGQTERAEQIRLTLQQTDRQRLSAEARQTARDALIALAEMVPLLRQAEHAEVAQRAEAFRGKYGNTVWQAMASHLAGQARKCSAKSGPPSQEMLVKTLSTATVNWHAAMRSGDLAKEELSRRAFAELNREHREELVRLARGQDVDVRAMATFALGFGRVPADLVTISASAGHEHGRVRAWAAYALAIRASPEVESDLLAALLTDADAKVRTRACQAAGRCIRESRADAAKFRKKLAGRLADEVAAVRSAAAEALGLIGTSADRAAVQAALEKERDPNARQAMTNAVQALGHR